ncbi:uncharacterized protein [Hetaerina americana]|uniref:uncharacterized protein n=1 Tax=Hetaerina americana TaxID=62018 RepID=UPI003A7F2825
MQRTWQQKRAAFIAGERGGGAMPVGRVAARAKKKLLGGSSGAFGKGSGLSAARVRERASLSFFLVLLFFGVFGLIVLTEILFIDGEAGSGGPGGRGRAAGVPGSRGRGSWGRRRGAGGLDAPDYEVEGGDEDSVVGPAAEDYFIYRGFRAAGASESKGVSSRFKAPAATDGGKGKKNGFRVFSKSDVEEAANAAIMVGSEDDAMLAAESKLPPVKDAEWQPVKGTRFKFYVYSAYYDSRGGERMVRIIGATRTRSPERVWCRLWLSSSSPANFTFPPSTASPSASSGNVNASSAGNSSETRGDTRLVATVLARVKVIRENWNLKYSACFVICPLRAVLGGGMTGGSSTATPGEGTHRGEFSTARGKSAAYSLPSASGPPTGPPPWPLWVSVVSRSRRAVPAHRLKVRNTEAHQLAEAKLDPRFGERWGVCIKPLHFSYNQALHMVEFIEFHSLLGFEHFTMYNHTVGPAVGCILNHYAQKGIVTLLPWSLDMASQREIRTEGLFAALNDCLYRSMHRFRYLALIDLDEFIVPRKFQQNKDQPLSTGKPPVNLKPNNTDSSLADLLASLVARAPAAGAFSFQNAFFYLQWADDEESPQPTKPTKPTKGKVDSQTMLPDKMPALVTQRKTRRRARAHPHKQRSKYICRPERVVEAGNHFVWEFTSGGGGMGIGGGSVGAVHVPSDAALLHHYRVCEFGGDDCIRTAASVVDRTAQRFRDPLLRRVAIQWAEMREPCGLPPMVPGEGDSPHR